MRRESRPAPPPPGVFGASSSGVYQGKLLPDETLRKWGGTAGKTRSAIAHLQREGERLRRDNIGLARENRRLRASLEKTLDMSVESPVFKGGLGGRTAIESYRANTGTLVHVLNEVGVRAILYGTENARFFLRSVFKLDLETIWAAPPRTLEEAQRRDDLRHALTVDEETDLLCSPDAVGERARQDFISAVAASGVDTSTQELIRRSGEFTRRGAGPVAVDGDDGD